MAKRSAGLLMYRWNNNELQVFLVHPGGPFWAKKDLGAWSVSKGEYVDGEIPSKLQSANSGGDGLCSQGDFPRARHWQQSGGKVVCAWAFEAIATPPRWSAITARWNGRRAPAA